MSKLGYRCCNKVVPCARNKRRLSTSAGLLLREYMGTYLDGIWIHIQRFWNKKTYLKLTTIVSRHQYAKCVVTLMRLIFYRWDTEDIMTSLYVNVIAGPLCIPQSQTLQIRRSLHQSSASSSQLPMWAGCCLWRNSEFKIRLFPLCWLWLEFEFWAQVKNINGVVSIEVFVLDIGLL